VTIALTRSHEFDVGRICRLAYRTAGLLSVYMEMTTQQAESAKEFLELLVHGSETEGLFARSGTFDTITLVSGTDTYDLATSTLDTYGTAMYIAAGQTLTELPLQPISRETWQNLGVRVEGGYPTLYFTKRSASRAQVVLWPEPGAAEAGATVRFQVHRLRADVTDSNVTPDFEVFWADYFVTALAHKLAGASSLPITTVNDLERQAMQKLAKCRGKANQSVNQQIVIRHGRMR
jgi:hypothetical protein